MSLQFIDKNTLDFFNEAARVTVTHSVNLWEKQVDVLKENVNRNFNRALNYRQLNSPEEVLNYQRRVGEEELGEWKKAGEEYYEIAAAAKQDWLAVADKGRGLVERNINDAVERTATVFPNGKAAMFSETAKHTAKAVNDFFQNSVDLTNKAINNGVQNILQPAENGAAKAKPVAKKR